MSDWRNLLWRMFLFWLLNALNSHAGVLVEFERFPARHPEQVWAELARLAGSMLTFSLDSDLDAIPAMTTPGLK